MKIFKNIFCTVLLSLILSCHNHKEPTSDIEIIPVKTANIVSKNYAAPILSSGVIFSDVKTNLSFKATGIINRLYVDEGETIKKEQLLATINPTEINAHLATAKSNYEMANQDFNRMKNLYEDSAATKKEFERSQVNLNSNLQQLNIAKFDQKYASIYANTSGVVLKRFMNEGELASAGSSVYLISSINKNNWVIEIGISDKNWAKIKIGDSAVVTTDAYSNVKFEAQVSEMSAAANPATGTFKIKLKINPDNYKMINGLIASVKIYPSQKQELQFIPTVALIEANGYEGSVYILKKDQKTVEKRKVKIAFIDNNQIAVSSGLQGADEVITDGVSYLNANSKVVLKNSK